MKKNKKQNKNVPIAELFESQSQYGNRYFYGRLESGAKVFMQMLKNRKNERGEQIWQLFISE